MASFARGEGRGTYSRLGSRLVLVATIAFGQGCIAELDLGSHAVPGDAGVGGLDGGPGVEAGGPKLVFVTDSLFSGDLRGEGSAASGAAGADALCNADAKAARLDGVFKAWISTSTEDAKTRVGSVGPWQLTDGTMVFSGSTVDGPPRFAVHLTATRVDLFGRDTAVWTGTDARGLRDTAGRTCADWTSRGAGDEGSQGYAGLTSSSWTEHRAPGEPATEAAACDSRARLYCFQQ